METCTKSWTVGRRIGIAGEISVVRSLEHLCLETGLVVWGYYTVLVIHSGLTLWFHELLSTWFLCPRNSWGQNTWVGIFPSPLFFLTQGPNSGLSALQSDFNSLSHYGNHYKCFWCSHSHFHSDWLFVTVSTLTSPLPRFLLLWNSLGMNTRMGFMVFLWRTSPPKNMNLYLLCLLHFRKNIYLLSSLGSLYRRCASVFQSTSSVIAAACLKQSFRVPHHMLRNTTQ